MSAQPSKKRKHSPDSEPTTPAQVVVPTVDRPRPDVVPSPHQQSEGRKRSLTAYSDRTLKAKKKFMKNFMATATRVILDVQFSDLKAPPKRELPVMQDICDTALGPDQPAIVESSLYYTADDELVLAYLGQRLFVPCDVQHQPRTIGKQGHATPGSRIVRDGLSREQCDLYALCCQTLCSDLTLSKDKKRHKGTSTMAYPLEQSRADEADEDAVGHDNAHRYILPDDQHLDEQDGDDRHPGGAGEDSSMGVERSGVVHIGHGWIQQNQPDKGLFLLGATTNRRSVGPSHICPL
ncbi:hypothetical protein BKA70DRAFT_1453931 [Coprinopsis sp. MPI-PUGE-AT-0042]|nr:hypothetical protein BKA70DRAFT_1453931 [Coprinopsis sp. MPI-PUGE-AT-0042]